MNGKEIRVMLGATTVFQYIPLSLTSKRELSEFEYDCLEQMYDRLMTSLEYEYQKIGGDGVVDSIIIAKRLSINLNCSFTEMEKELILESLDICIAEAEARKDDSLNDYFNGDQYGLNSKDFIDLSARLKNIWN